MNKLLYQISEITLSLAISALQQIFRLHSCLAILAMVTRSRQKICAASLPNSTLFLIFGITFIMRRMRNAQRSIGNRCYP